MERKKLITKLQFSFEDQDMTDNFDVNIMPLPTKSYKRKVKIISVKRIKNDASTNKLF